MKYCCVAILALLLDVTLHGESALAESKPPVCATAFNIAVRDPLGNVDTGFSPPDSKWWFKKISKHYPGICYSDLKSNEGVWFYVDISNRPAGTEAARSRSTVNSDGSVTTNTNVNDIRTAVYTLKLIRFQGGRPVVLRTFQRAKTGADGTVTGLLGSLGNPEREVILDALDWLSSLTPTIR